MRKLRRTAEPSVLFIKHPQRGIYDLLNCRRRELTRLIYWASVKGYQKPLRLYRARLQDEEIRIYRYTLHHHRAATFAYIVHIFNSLFFPRPRYFRPGIASHYNRSF